MAKISDVEASKKWGVVEKLEYLIGVRYDKKNHGLYVPNSIDTIPVGLKGVDIVYVYYYHFPEFISPDFKGRIKYNISDIEMPQEWVENAKKNYQENEKLARSARYDRFTDSWSVLPENMRFFEDDSGLICLDLTKTNIKQVNDIYIQGVDKIMMPSQQISSHLSHQCKYQKLKIKE